MGNERHVTHPKHLPYFVVATDDAGNPPRMELFGTEMAAIDHAAERAYHNREEYLVFKVSLIATAVPQRAVISRSAAGKSDAR